MVYFQPQEASKYLLLRKVTANCEDPVLPILKDITLGRFIPGDSALHGLDPRAKLFITAVWMIVLLSSSSGLIPVLVLGLSLLLGKVSGFPLRFQLRNFRPLIPILVLTFILNAMLTPGEKLYALPGGTGELSFEGIRRGLFLLLRLCALVLMTTLLTLSTSPLELADGLESILRPLKRLGLPAHELAMTITIALRFVPILIDEADRLRMAQLARGADFGGGPIRRAKSLLPVLLPLFQSAFGRADRLAVAMEARCYQGEKGRTHYRILAMSFTDYSVLTVSLLAAGLTMGLGGF